MGPVPGYAAGHTIYDLFHYSARLTPGNQYYPFMSASNFLHEMGHSFNVFSGFGGQSFGSFFAVSGFDTTALSALQAAGIDRENDSVTATEIYADLVMAAAEGNLPTFVQENIDLFRRSVRNAVMYHAPVEVVARGLNASVSTLRIGSVDARVRATDDSTTVYNIIGEAPAGSEVIVLGRTEGEILDQVWIYVALPSGQATRYGWINATLFSNQDILNDVSSIIKSDAVDPSRPFDPFDPLNWLYE
jgi:hypothetical protein